MSLPDILFKGVPRRFTRGYTLEIIQKHKPEKVVIPCVGAFALATTATEGGIRPEQIEACDISLYTSVIGCYLAGKDLPVRPRQGWEWLAPYMEDMEGRVAAVALAIRLLQYGYGSPKKLPVFKRERIREIWERRDFYIEQLRGTARSMQARLGGIQFQPEDMWALLGRHVPDPTTGLPVADPNTLILCNPPRYCLAPNERILTADLRWVPCGELGVGDEILAFDEEAGLSGRRRWRFAEITHSEPMEQECVRVHLEDGTSVVCTVDHPWLADPYSYTASGRTWVRADALMGVKAGGRGLGRGRNTPYYVLKALDTWVPERSYEAGWLAGMFDGEGSIHLRKDSTALSLTQVDGPVQDRVAELMDLLGFDFGTYARTGESRKPIATVATKGGFAEQLRLLGTVRPERLIAGLREKWHEARGCEAMEKLLVVGVEPVGRHPIQSISTSSRTYVGEGFLMHNTGGYDKMYAGVDDAFDWGQPNVRQFDETQYAPLVRFLAGGPHCLIYYATPVAAPVDPADEWGEPWTSVFAHRPKTGASAAINWIVSNKPERTKLQRADVEKPIKAKYKLFREGRIDPENSRLEVKVESKEVASYYRDLFVHNLGHLNAERYKILLLDGKLLATVGLHLQNLRAGGSMAGVAKLRFAFTVDHPDYDKLHKLTLLSVVSAWFWAGELSDIEPAPRAVQTTMLTPHPEAKTARGIFRLENRETDKETGQYKLSYFAEVVDRTPQETLKIFMERWGR